MWDDIAPGLSTEAAKPKRPEVDAPTQQRMKADIRPAQQRKPTADQKRVRRQMARQAGAVPTAAEIDAMGEGEVVTVRVPPGEANNGNGVLHYFTKRGDRFYQGTADTRGRTGADILSAFHAIDARYNAEIHLKELSSSPFANGGHLSSKQASAERSVPCADCGGALYGDYSMVHCSKCGASAVPTVKADADLLGLKGSEVFRIGTNGLLMAVTPSHTGAFDGSPSIWAPNTPIANVWGKDYFSLEEVVARMSAIDFSGGPSDDRVSEWDALQAVLTQHSNRNDFALTASTTTKESTAMTQPTEQDLIQRLARATTLVEQSALQIQLENVRTASRESAAQEGSLDWGSMGALPPTREQQSAASLISGASHMAGVTASTRLGHTDATDWLMDMSPAETPDTALSAVARASATNWFQSVWGPVKQDREEFSVQAHNAARRDCAMFGLQSTAAASVYMDQIKHLASREGLSLVALETTVDTYVSDGKTTTPVGVSPSTASDSMDEWTIGTDLNGGSDPKSTSTEGDAPSMKEGDTPENATGESLDNPNFGEGPDKSEWAVGNTDDKMSTQGGRKTAGVNVSKVKIVDRNTDTFSGVTDDGTTVQFHLSPEDGKRVRDVMFSDLGINFSGLEIEQSDIITEQGGGNSMSGPSRSASIEARMAAEFGGYGHGIQTYAQEEQSGAADGLSSATAPEDAPSLSEGSQPEGDHAESFTQNNGEGAKDMSSATDSDRPGGGVEWGSTAARTPRHSLASIGSTFAGKPVSQNVALFGKALTAAASLNDSVGGVSIRRVAHALANNAEVPANVRTALMEHLAADGSACSVCGDKIAKDPSGEDPSTYHHDNGEKHDHEAKPAGGESKEAQRAPFVREAAGDWKVGDRLTRDGKTYEVTRISPAGSAGTSEADGPTYHATIVVDGEVKSGGYTADIWSKSASNQTSAFSKTSARTAADNAVCSKCGYNIYKNADGSWVGQDDKTSCGDGGTHSPRESKESAKSDTCPKCSAHMSNVVTNADNTVLTATCDSCGWSGSKRKTAGAYAGGSPKHGDTAKCHKDGKSIEFFDGAWYHLNSDPAPSHNDVHPGTPKEIADGTAMGSKVAGEVPEAFKQNWDKGDGDDADKKDESDEGKPWENSATAAFRRRVQANLSRVIAGGDFRLTDAQNDEGEWTMSPEQIRAEMNAGMDRDPGDETDDWYRDAARHTAGTSASPEAGSETFTQTDRGDGYKKAKCKNCGGGLRRKDMAASGWTHSKTNTKWCPEGEAKTAAKSSNCENGNHSSCTGSSCSCSCHKASKSDYSGACGDGDHSECSMNHGATKATMGDRDCLCPDPSHKKTGSKQAATYTCVHCGNGIHGLQDPTGQRAGISWSDQPNTINSIDDRGFQCGMNFTTGLHEPAADWHEGSRKTANGDWIAQVAGVGEGVWSGNGMTFDSPDSAKAWIADLSTRWFGFDMGRVVPVGTPSRQPVDMDDPTITHNFR
jgi:hypothetical protein